MKAKALALLALLLIPAVAYAAITGTEGRMGNQRVAIGEVQIGRGTATAVTNAATITNGSGIITTEVLTTAAGATQAITLTNTRIAAGDMVFSSLDPNGSAGTPAIANVAVSANTAVFLIQNIHASAALNAALKISFWINKSGNTN